MCVITDYHKEKKIGTTLVIGEKRLHAIGDGFELLDLLGDNFLQCLYRTTNQF